MKVVTKVRVELALHKLAPTNLLQSFLRPLTSSFPKHIGQARYPRRPYRRNWRPHNRLQRRVEGQQDEQDAHRCRLERQGGQCSEVSV